MGHRFSVHDISDVTLVTTTETVVATLTGVTTTKPGQRVCLTGRVTLTTGTATTNVRLRVRRDSLTGTEIPEAPNDAAEAAAGGIESHDIYVEDSTLGERSGATYVLTVTQTAASANGVTSQQSLIAEVEP